MKSIKIPKRKVMHISTRIEKACKEAIKGFDTKELKDESLLLRRQLLIPKIAKKYDVKESTLHSILSAGRLYPKQKDRKNEVL